MQESCYWDSATRSVNPSRLRLCVSIGFSSTGLSTWNCALAGGPSRGAREMSQHSESTCGTTLPGFSYFTPASTCAPPGERAGVALDCGSVHESPAAAMSENPSREVDVQHRRDRVHVSQADRGIPVEEQITGEKAIRRHVVCRAARDELHFCNRCAHGR